MTSKFRSKLEAKVALNLHERKVKYKYEAERIPYEVTHSYTTDFTLPNGIVVEVKGFFKPSDRNKHLRLKKQHPERDIRFLFDVDNRLHKNSETRYSDWCKKHGFLYAFKVVPQEWIDEPKKRRK